MEEPIEVSEMEISYQKAMDIRGIPTTICPCGSKMWNLKTIFEQDTGKIDMYFLDMECALCGTLATAPTPEGFDEQDANI